MATPFILRSARPRLPEPVASWSYDPELQLNMTPNGLPNDDDWKLMLRTKTTSSIAGSKRSDDDD